MTVNEDDDQDEERERAVATLAPEAEPAFDPLATLRDPEVAGRFLAWSDSLEALRAVVTEAGALEDAWERGRLNEANQARRELLVTSAVDLRLALGLTRRDLIQVVGDRAAARLGTLKTKVHEAALAVAKEVTAKRERPASVLEDRKPVPGRLEVTRVEPAKEVVMVASESKAKKRREGARPACLYTADATPCQSNGSARGLCAVHYMREAKRVRQGNTTWDELYQAGGARPPTRGIAKAPTAGDEDPSARSAVRALKGLQQDAKRSGADKLSQREVNEEIAAARGPKPVPPPMADPELEAMRSLTLLDGKARERVLSWASSRFAE